jgi:CheY-like chemotaxis protein
MRVLFLDDDPDRLDWARGVFKDIGNPLELVTTAQEAILALARQDFDLVCLDHDLEGVPHDDPAGDNTGSAVVRWILANRPKVRQFVVHSLSRTGAKPMARDLAEAGYRVRHKPFTGLVCWKPIDFRVLARLRDNETTEEDVT